MKTKTLQSDLLLLLTAAIWGFGFVAQRLGMDELGPFGFNAARFMLGALSLLPIIWLMRRRAAKNKAPQPEHNRRTLLWGGLLAGLLLFSGAALQQVGLVYTTAGKAGFITGLYIILVPLIGLLWGQRTNLNTWLGGLLALVGLYLLSVTDDMTLAYGDLLELIGAFFWAGHVLIIGWLSTRTDVLFLSVVQYLVCTLLNLVIALQWETFNLAAVWAEFGPVAYAGIMSVGVAYTLQVIGQRNAPVAHAAILLSLEAVFAVIGGWLMLGEVLSARGLAGCALMLAGMLLSQLKLPRRLRQRKSAQLETETAASDTLN